MQMVMIIVVSGPSVVRVSVHLKLAVTRIRLVVDEVQKIRHSAFETLDIMLDETEKKECLKILELISYENLVSLTDTVSGKVVTVENKEEALNAIMLYTRTGEELLKRRKVRREHLYQYLAHEGHVEHPAADKASLLKKVLMLWEARKLQKDDLEEQKPAIALEQETHSFETTPTESTSQVDNAPSTSDVPVKPHEGDEGQLLALHFSSWFYQMLQSLAGKPVKEDLDWGPQHFWQDAELTVQFLEPAGNQEMTVEGARLVSEKFLSMIVLDRLCFNPNISNESVHGKQNPHGLTVVMVCGTVHRDKQYIGVFEQKFGLIRDPTEENNWKIKFSKLILRATGCGSNNQLPEAS